MMRCAGRRIASPPPPPSSGVCRRGSRSLRVTVRRVDSIAAETSGKFRYVVSHVALAADLGRTKLSVRKPARCIDGLGKLRRCPHASSRGARHARLIARDLLEPVAEGVFESHPRHGGDRLLCAPGRARRTADAGASPPDGASRTAAAELSGDQRIHRSRRSSQPPGCSTGRIWCPARTGSSTGTLHSATGRAFPGTSASRAAIRSSSIRARSCTACWPVTCS